MIEIEINSYALVNKSNVKPNNKVLKIIPQSPANINNGFIIQNLFLIQIHYTSVFSQENQKRELFLKK